MVRLLLSVLVLLTANCYLVSDNMVGGEEAVITDTGLPGLWRSPGKPGFFLILSHKDGTVSFFFFEKDFVADSEYYAGRATKVGDDTFLNLRRYRSHGEEAADTGYIPAYYRVKDDKLDIALFGTEFFDTAIQAKKLKGVASVKKSTYSSTPTRLTGTGTEIADFLRANLKTPGALEKTVSFERVTMPVVSEE